MKKLIFPAFLLLLVSIVSAQDPAADTSKWKVDGFGSLNLNQVSFTNWAAGGDNSVSFAFKALMTAKYAHKRHHWDNGLITEYGLIWTDEDGIRKNEDKLELESKYGFDLNKKKTLLLSALANFKSQFANGYNYPNDSLVISKFAAPGYLTLGLGIDWKPVDYFSLFVSPATGKITFIRDETIANSGVYGNEAAVRDSLGNVTKKGETTVFQFGAYLNAKFNKEIVKNVTFASKLELFANYTGKTKASRMVDVNWQNAFLFKINEWLAASLTLDLIYDKEIMIPKDENENGSIELNEFKSRVQFKEGLGLGLTYKFNNKKEPKK